MTDKDSWWQDDNRGSKNDENPFQPRDVQNDGKSFAPRSVNENFSPRSEYAERNKKSDKK
jgi:hypothetical protein